MIVTERLSKSFGKLQAVQDLDLRVEAGEVFGFLGPNGAGKTTTVRMLSGLIGPTSGKAWVAGCEVGKQDVDLPRMVGILTESPGLYDRLSAERNLGFFAVLSEVHNIAAQVERYLRLLGLWDRRHEPVGGFSKGMRQKLAIARAMLHEPQVVFLDEPTSALDPEAARLVREFIGELRDEGRAIVLCTHNLDEADRLCDRIAVFRTRILALDTPAALRRQLFGRSVVFHMREVSPAHLMCLKALPVVRSVEAVDRRLVVSLEEPERDNPRLIRALVEAGAEIQFVGELRRTLEDVYLRLVEQSDPVQSS